MRSPRGEPVAWHEPTFHQGGPELFSVGYTFGAERMTSTYDFMSRRLQSWRSGDGHQTERRDYHGLAVDVWDPENLAAGSPHFDRFKTVTTDGHGRQIRVRDRAVDGTLETLTDYLATGEVAAIERKSMAGGDVRYRRWMKYDSMAAWSRMRSRIPPSVLPICRAVHRA